MEHNSKNTSKIIKKLTSKLTVSKFTLFCHLNECFFEKLKTKM